MAMGTAGDRHATRSRLPTLLVSHGAPTLALERTAEVVDPSAAAGSAPAGAPVDAAQPAHGGLALRLAELGQRLERPAAILVASAHWATAQPMLTGASSPSTVHDFGGFGDALQQLRYPAPGAPALARRACDLLAQAGIAAGIDPRRGLDHGAWVPLRHLYPRADVPVVQLSIQPGRDARHHYALGEALAPLADEGVLIIGSGGITHNLHEAFARRDRSGEMAWTRAFADWIDARLAARDPAALLDWQRRAPDALRNHPTDEHLLPLFVALGAAGSAARAERVHRGSLWGALALDCWQFSG
jgi:4,5-DOPA dioxygenase extradiol